MILKRTWALINYVIGEYGRDNCNQLAAAISYYVLFSIVPFTIFTVSVFGLAVGRQQLQKEITPAVVDFVGLRQGAPLIEVDEARVANLYGPVVASEVVAAARALTPEETSQISAKLAGERPQTVTIGGRQLTSREVSVRYDNSVATTLHDVSQIGGPLTIVGLLVTAWSGSAMIGAVRRALQAVWKVERQRPFFQQKVRDLTMAGTLGLLLLASIVATGFLQAVRALSDKALGPVSTDTGIFWGALPFVLPFLFSFLVISLTYRYVPGVRMSFRYAWPGALFAALMFEVLKNAFAFYVANFRAYDIIYGSLAGILLFLTSVYLSAAILLVGAELTLALPRLVSGSLDPVVDPNAPQAPFLKRATRDAAGFIRGLFFTRPEAKSAGGGRRPQQR